MPKKRSTGTYRSDTASGRSAQGRDDPARSVTAGTVALSQEIGDSLTFWGLLAAEAEQIEYVHHPAFSLPSAEKWLWGTERRPIPVPQYHLLPEITGELDETRPTRTALTRDDERLLFLRYNYAKYRLRKLLAAEARKRRSALHARRLSLWAARAGHIHRKLVHANLPLVPSMAQRVTRRGVDYEDLVSEGYMAILRSIEKFDVSRGYKFSTYACRSIFACFGRLRRKAGVRQKHIPAYYDPDLDKSDEADRRHTEQRSFAIYAVSTVLADNRAGLSEQEQKVIRQRYGLDDASAGRTFKEIGTGMDLSVERVRQIKENALDKIRGALQQEFSS